MILRGEALAQPPTKAVDMGCGGGRWSSLLAGRGWDVTSTDIDPQSLAVCQRNVPGAKCVLVKSTDQRIPVASGSLRLVLCMEVPQIVEAEWWPAEVYRVAAEGGIIIGVQFNVRSWRSVAWRWKRRLTNRLGDGSYSISYSDWRNRFLGTGFAMVREEGYCWGPFSRDSNSAFVHIFAKAERALGLHRIVLWAPWVLFIARKISK